MKIIGQTDLLRVYGKRPSKYATHDNPVEIAMERRKALDERASFAMVCMEKWGMVAGEPAGEDSAGRHRLGLMSEADVVKRACTMAQLAFDEFERLGWGVSLPSTAELEEVLKDAEDGKN